MAQRRKESGDMCTQGLIQSHIRISFRARVTMKEIKLVRKIVVRPAERR